MPNTTYTIQIRQRGVVTILIEAAHQDRATGDGKANRG